MTAREYNQAHAAEIMALHAGGFMPFDPVAGDLEARVRVWQGANGLTPDGKLGPATAAAMRARYGAKPAADDAGAARVARARSVCGRKDIRYVLGAGGYDPTAPTPANAEGGCDCSGFQAWVHGRSRRPSGDFAWDGTRWWFSTDSVWSDARNNSVGLFDRVDPNDVRPGDIVVYPDPPGGQGHIALVSDPATFMVIECGMRKSWRRAHPEATAIGERPRPDMFAHPKRVFGRYKG